jgi:hypothetical protein
MAQAEERRLLGAFGANCAAAGGSASVLQVLAEACDAPGLGAALAGARWEEARQLVEAAPAIGGGVISMGPHVRFVWRTTAEMCRGEC